MAEASFFYPPVQQMKSLLILSVGYGQGHHSAASALAEEFSMRGWECRTEDLCEAAHPNFFAKTQRFYDFCVRRAPWLWGVTYAQTDTADWRHAVKWPLLRDVVERLRRVLGEMSPDVVLCTYPLYAYMLDALRREGVFHGRYAVVVTDALVISRPWVQSAAPLLFVPDEFSQELICSQFGLSRQVVVSGGFPVKKRFAPSHPLSVPTASDFRILFGAFRPAREVVRTVRAILHAYPAAKVTLLGSARYGAFRRLLLREIESRQVELLPPGQEMSDLMARSHLYIGKAGAATMFECYAEALPMIVNFALPGQEQGNLELLLRDGAGIYADSPESVVSALNNMLADGAAGWRAMRTAMMAAHQKRGGAARIADETERRLLT